MNNEIILTEETIDEIIGNAKGYGIILLKHTDENNVNGVWSFGNGDADMFFEATGIFKFIFTDTTVDVALVK